MSSHYSISVKLTPEGFENGAKIITKELNESIKRAIASIDGTFSNNSTLIGRSIDQAFVVGSLKAAENIKNAFNIAIQRSKMAGALPTFNAPMKSVRDEPIAREKIAKFSGFAGSAFEQAGNALPRETIEVPREKESVNKVKEKAPNIDWLKNFFNQAPRKKSMGDMGLPKDMPAMLHQGERVLSRSEVQFLKNMKIPGFGTGKANTTSGEGLKAPVSFEAGDAPKKDQFQIRDKDTKQYGRNITKPISFGNVGAGASNVGGKGVDKIGDALSKFTEGFKDQFRGSPTTKGQRQENQAAANAPIVKDIRALRAGTGKDIGKVMENLLNSNVSGFAKLLGPLGIIVSIIQGMPMIQKIMKLISTLVTMIFMPLGYGLMMFLLPIIRFLAPNIAKLMLWGMKVMQTYVPQITAFLGSILGGIGSLASDIGNFINKYILKPLESIFSGYLNLGEKIWAWVLSGSKTLLDIGDKVWNFLLSMAKTELDIGLSIWNWVLGEAKTSLDLGLKVWSWVLNEAKTSLDLGMKVWDWIVNQAKTTLDIGAQVWKMLVNWVAKPFDLAVWVEKTLTDWFNSAGKSATSIIGSLAKGLGIPGLQTGSLYIPKDMLVQAHQGERLMTQGENKASSGGNIQPFSPTIYLTVQTAAQSPDQIVQSIMPKLTQELYRQHARRAGTI